METYGLEKLGIINFATTDVRNVIEHSDIVASETERLARVCEERRARAMGEARRFVQMAELLTTGGFVQEGIASSRKAIALTNVRLNL